MVVRIHHIQISIAPERLAESRAFYIGLLGFTEITDPFPSNNGFWLAGGEVEIHVRPEANIARDRTRAHPALLFDRLDPIRAALTAAGVRIEEQPDIPDLMRFHTFDPSGNRLELMQAI